MYMCVYVCMYIYIYIYAHIYIYIYIDGERAPNGAHALYGGEGG